MYTHSPWASTAVSLVAWTFAFVVVGAVARWAYGRYVAATPAPDRVHDPSAVQVRVLTTDDEVAARGTVATLPDDLDPDQVRVVATSAVHVPGAVVHVVPDEFETDAAGTARALSWARRHVPCEREYVWYVDDSTAVGEFEGLPDADVVRYRATPSPSGSALAYWSEVVRTGARARLPAWPRLDVLPRSFRGAIAVRAALEPTVGRAAGAVEAGDAAAAGDAAGPALDWPAATDHAVVDGVVRTAAPASVGALVGERLAWLRGALAPSRSLDATDRVGLFARGSAIAVAPLAAVATAVPFALPTGTPALDVLQRAAVGFLALAATWFVLGAVADDRRRIRDVVLDPFAPVVRRVRRVVGAGERATGADTVADGGRRPRAGPTGGRRGEGGEGAE